MTAPLCVRCGRPTPDGYGCEACGRELAGVLLTASGHADDAEAVVARQARYGAGGRGGRGEPLPVDLTAATRLALVSNAVTTWARHVIDESGATMPRYRPVAGPGCPIGWCGHGSCAAIRRGRRPSVLGEAAGWLATKVDWIRKRPEAAEAFTDLHHACAQLARLVDRPPDKDLVGMCDCGKVLYAPRGKVEVQCPETTCGLRWNVEQSRNILRRSLDGKLVTAAEAARLAQYLDTDRTQDQIRKLINAWSSRALIEAHGEIEGEPTFRFGAIAERLARTPRRTARADHAA